MSNRGTGVALVAISAICFGVLPVLTTLAYDDGARLVGVLAVRFTGAAILLGLALLVRGNVRLPHGRHLLALIALGGVCYVAQSASYFGSLAVGTPASLVALLLYLYPALVVALAALLLHERPTRIGAICVLVALAGTALTIGPAFAGRPLGVALGLLAALAYSLYVLGGSLVVPRAGPLVSIFVIMTSAAVVYDVAALIMRPALPETARGWAAIAGVMLLATVVSSLTFFAGAARIGAADASVISTLEPVVSVALAGAVLGQLLAPVQLAGGALVLAAVGVLARTRKPPLLPPRSDDQESLGAKSSATEFMQKR